MSEQAEPQHRPITVTLWDTATGETCSNSEYTPWHWAYGNGACDCNRAAMFGREQECGQSRYYVIETSGDESGYTVEEDYNNYFTPIPKPAP